MSPEDKKQRPVQAILPLSACYNMDMTDLGVTQLESESH